MCLADGGGPAGPMGTGDDELRLQQGTHLRGVALRPLEVGVRPVPHRGLDADGVSGRDGLAQVAHDPVVKEGGAGPLLVQSGQK